ncbi:SUMO-interacting motif-containing protein 1 isoform X2 [Hyla sarda]|uniref:SUMO-interacting motif-containing protein 1 isoform X2 n=1 Tax=Hyla sarda TaxID=327740 RepID=UPI0024C4569F|nr:SUMO-interacting motif-containing protein 1 isoform X2 [Hyla sarda]
MDDVIVISHSDESEEDGRIWRKRKRPRSASPAQDIIDLTGDSEVFAYVTSSDDTVIDLTVHEEEESDGTFQQQLKSETKNGMGSPSECRGSDLDSDVDMNDESCDSKDLDYRSSSSENGSICSTESITNLGQQNGGVPEGSDKGLPAKNIKHPYVTPVCFQNHYKTIHNQDYESAPLETGTQVQHISSSTLALSPAVQKNPEETLCSPSTTVNKSLLYKLRYFKKPPVNHLFPHTVRNCKNSEPTPMPLSRMNLVNNTKDEGFHQGTLYFMNEFVSASHYPPKELISHVITSTLLGAEEQTIRHDAYMILMKVQRLHPATSESVAWEWKLLSEVMSKQENQTCHLFLQYVVQTLDDDFHLCLQRRNLHKCLCKAMLSCDKSFCNVKQVIHWLIDAVKQIPENDQDPLLQCYKQRPVFLFQRMLSIAVEVDNSPTMNSNKIADYTFPYVTVLKTRQQREMFFISTENILLRAKILELIFLHSCEFPPPPNLSLCFSKILYFISNTTLQLENQGSPLQRWDEMLHHIIMLCLSLQTVITDHLRTPVIDRQDEIIKRPHCLFHQSEAITESEVDISLTHFRTALGAEPPASFLNRLFLLRSLLNTAVKRYN